MPETEDRIVVIEQHIRACKYSGMPLTPESQMADDCCCDPPRVQVPRCGYVTGSSQAESSEITRRGSQRSDGRWEVLCGYPASFMVGAAAIPACSRDLHALVQQSATENPVVTVIVIKPRRDRRAVAMAARAQVDALVGRKPHIIPEDT